jgi:hypothetical protein
MSDVIDNTEELLRLVKKLGVKVGSVEELSRLLTAVNASYNPDAARVKAAKTVGVAVPCATVGVVGVCSFFLLANAAEMPVAAHPMAALAVMWGVTGLVCLASLIFSLILLRHRRVNVTPARQPERGPSEALLRPDTPTGITDQLAADLARHFS